MIKYDGMRAEENQSVPKNLPAGPYVAKVLDTVIDGDEPDQSLILYLDVAEGEYEGFYLKQYKAAKERGSQFEIKYKGTMRLRIPNPDNKKALYPESDARRMNDMIFRFESSNPGFHWDGDETKLKGKTVGISVQDASYNGKAFTKIARLEIADDVREGKINVMRPRETNLPDPTKTTPAKDQGSGMEVVTEELPWREDDKPY